ncbi:MAG: TSUP family transporter, partial [Acidiferrobacterales bacterium]|nr:TSUP family transporter [Acidiferrobacterales bacterium]
MLDFSYWYFFILALFGAIVANATGAGGGVVFVPAFSILGIADQSIIATSFAIQCFGMTAGMIAWRGFAKQQIGDPEQNAVWGNYWL